MKKVTLTPVLNIPLPLSLLPSHGAHSRATQTESKDAFSNPQYCPYHVGYLGFALRGLHVVVVHAWKLAEATSAARETKHILFITVLGRL